MSRAQPRRITTLLLLSWRSLAGLPFPRPHRGVSVRTTVWTALIHQLNLHATYSARWRIWIGTTQPDGLGHLVTATAHDCLRLELKAALRALPVHGQAPERSSKSCVLALDDGGSLDFRWCLWRQMSWHHDIFFCVSPRSQ